jgi:branched-chain amino acid transport system permease protein
MAVIVVERMAYRPLRNAPRLVPLISAIGVSFFLQDAIRLVESLTTGQFHRIIPPLATSMSASPVSIPVGGLPMNLGIEVKSLWVIVAAVLMLVG